MSGKSRSKNGVICLVSMCLSYVMVLKLSKKLSKKRRSVKAIYIYASQSSHYTLSENDMVYKGLSNRSWDIKILKYQKDADLAEI